MRSLTIGLQTETPGQLQSTPCLSFFSIKWAVVAQTINAALPAKFTLKEVDLLLPCKVSVQHSITQHGGLVKQF